MNEILLFTDRLKSETQQQHSAIEQAYWMQQLMHPALTKEQYTGILKKWHPIFFSFEKQLEDNKEAVEKIIPDWDSRKKTALLEKDISLLGDTIPVPDTDTDVIAINELVGAFYVLEGSALGGRVILKKLTQHDWFDSSFGNFFAGYGAETGSQWMKFRDYLNLYAAEADKKAGEIIEAANKTFGKLCQHFN